MTFTIEKDGVRVVKLASPIEGANCRIDEMRLRVPKYKDFIELGDPTTLIVAKDVVVPYD